ncbi:MAG: putative bifunctional diguanylate cyclase/phosphodiesterase [Moorellales bacterium]
MDNEKPPTGSPGTGSGAGSEKQETGWDAVRPVLSALSIPAALVDRDFRVLDLNQALLDKLGQNRQEVIGRLCRQVFCRRDTPPDHCVLSRTLISRRQENATIWSQDGNTALLVTSIPLFDREGTIARALLVHADVTEQQKSETWRLIAGRLLQTTTDGVLILDQNQVVQWANPAFTRLTGYPYEEIVGREAGLLRSDHHDAAFCQHMWEEVARRGHWEGEFWYRHKNGEIQPRWLTLSAVRGEGGQPTYYVAVYSNRAQKSNNFATIQHFTHYDPLTGLGNRLQLSDRFAFASAHATRLGLTPALLYIDLDDFREVNRALGYAAGDQVLQAVAERLRRTVREDDTVVRLGGDEFVLLLLLQQPEDATLIARKVLEAIAPPLTTEGREIRITATIGIALYPRDGREIEELLRAGHSAMERARERGRNTWEYYAPGLEAVALRRFALEQELRRTLDGAGLLVYYQPRVSLHTGAVAGVEALVRWQHPTWGLLMPRDFIPIAEEADLIFGLGKKVLETACAQVRQWHRVGYRPLVLSVNLSAQQFRHPDLGVTIRQVLEDTGLDPSSLELEITESTAIRDLELSRKVIRYLSEMGAGIVIDDFGVGYCALNYLKYFPVKALKIDRSFVQGLGESPADEAIVATMIALAHNLGALAVAEGVETERQLHWLRLRGCDEVQGFWFSPPLPPEEVEGVLKRI